MIAAEVTVDSPDFGHLQPMVAPPRLNSEAGNNPTPGVVVADAGDRHQAQMQEITGRGTGLSPAGRRQTKGPRPGWDGGLYAFMDGVLATEPRRPALRKRKA